MLRWRVGRRNSEGQETSQNKQHVKQKVICRVQLEFNVQKEDQDRLQEGKEKVHRQMSIFSVEG